MYSEEDIDSAVAAGIFEPATAQAFRAHVARLRHTSAVDEEHFRLISGFNDIFVVIACLLLLASVAWIGGEVGAWLGGAAVAAVAWLLAEFFTRRRRMALPSIVLLLAFVAGIFSIGVSLLDDKNQAVMVSGVLAALGAWYHWRRFQVPITVAAGVAATIACLLALLLAALPTAQDWLTVIAILAGMVVFGLAMRWDGQDPLRQSRKSDVAFWLHLLAAPLLVHPIFGLLGVFDGETSLIQALAVVLLYLVIGLTSLCIDRRALMVSALIYVLYTFSALLKQHGVVSLSFAITALVIGSGLLLLSAFWHVSRRHVLARLPRALRQRLAPCR